MINESNLSELKQDLQSRRKELTQKIEADKIRANEEEYSTELSNYDNHPGDLGTELYEREKDLAITSHEITELESIESALKRIEYDEYGTCEVCGADIDLERLKARPETNVCYEHAESKPRSIEENESSMSSLENDDTDSWNTLADYGSSQSPIDRDVNSVDYQGSVEERDGENPDEMDRFSNDDSIKE